MPAGGARPGAGRKPAPEKGIARNVILTQPQWEQLAAIAKARGRSF